jgi:hypothetical protein
VKIWAARSYLMAVDCGDSILRSDVIRTVRRHDGMVLQFERMEFCDGTILVQASEWLSGRVLHSWVNQATFHAVGEKGGV